MKKREMFRTCIFGGYNKNDVNEYVHSLENEIEKFQNEKEKGTDTITLSTEQEKSAVENGQDIFIFDEIPKKETSLSQEAHENRGNNVSADEAERGVSDFIENEKEKYENEITALKMKCQDLKEELVALRKERDEYEDDYKAVKNVLLNARVDAEIIVAKAREKANLIMKDATKKLEDKRKESYILFTKCIEENQNSLVISKEYFESQIRNIEDVQKKIKMLKMSVNKSQVEGE